MVRSMSYGKLWWYVTSALVRAKGEGGQALGEFTLVLAFVALVALLALTAIGVAVLGFYQPVADAIG
jgi:Flp pilus assembly pilin Flp